jgi:hypothetical protein
MCPSTDSIQPTIHRGHVIGGRYQNAVECDGKKFEDPLLLERGDMGLEVLLRSWRKRRQPIEAYPPDSPDLSESPDDQDKSANDNGKVWPLIPFPDGWLGG